MHILRNDMMMASKAHRGARMSRGFSLIELLVVTAIIGLLMAVTIPAIGAIQGASAFGDSAGRIATMLEQARSYAMANNTSVYVTFKETDGTQEGGTSSGTGRLVLAAFAVRGGGSGYSASSDLVPLTKVMQFRGVSLDAAIPQTGNLARTPADSSVGGPAFPALAQPISSGKWTFDKALRFDPQGSAWASSDSAVLDTVEVGLRPAHGNVRDAGTPNLAALQIDALTGSVRLFRP